MSRNVPSSDIEPHVALRLPANAELDTAADFPIGCAHSTMAGIGAD
jgi:hypothetical protein